MFSKVILFWLLLGTKVLSLNYSQYVDLFIGTQGTVPGTSFNGGNVFPGASLPFGAVKVGIDTTELAS
jgi:putative alpha-1,2-mannosidase